MNYIQHFFHLLPGLTCLQRRAQSRTASGHVSGRTVMISSAVKIGWPMLWNTTGKSGLHAVGQHWIFLSLLRGHKTKSVICESKPFVIYGMSNQVADAQKKKMTLLPTVSYDLLEEMARKGDVHRVDHLAP